MEEPLFRLYEQSDDFRSCHRQCQRDESLSLAEMEPGPLLSARWQQGSVRLFRGASVFAALHLAFEQLYDSQHSSVPLGTLGCRWIACRIGSRTCARCT